MNPSSTPRNNNNSNNKTNEESSNVPQRLLLREIDFTVESIKRKILEKLDVIKDSSTKQAIDTSRRSSRRVNPPSFNTEALRAFERGLSREMETLKYGLLNAGRPFKPAIVNTVEVPATIGFNYGANVYNQKHNMIISCPSNSNVHFFDGTDFTAMKNRRKRELSSSVVQMSYCAESDTHLMGCAFGDIYSYNATTNNFSKVTKEGDSFILAITHITPTTYAFSSSKSGKLYFGSTDKPRAIAHDSKDSDAWFLHPIKEQGLLLSGLANGKLTIYNTNKGPKYPMVACIQAHRFGKYVTAIKNVFINGKEYIITGGNDHTIKIWHFIKGKMRLLKVIQNSEDVSTIVYLENYQMIASTHHKDYIKFFKIPSGKLEGTLNVGLNKARNIFLMNDKNMLGVADLTRNLIKIIQLHPQENNATAQTQ